MLYYRNTKIHTAKKGAFKLCYITRSAKGEKRIYEPPLLFNVEKDSSEQYNSATNFPEIIKEIDTMVSIHKKTVKPGRNKLVDRMANKD